MIDLSAVMFRPRTDRMNKAQWTNGKKIVNGWWEYIWQSDRFLIILDVKDRLTGSSQKTIRTDNDTPEWGKFRLVN